LDISRRFVLNRFQYPFWIFAYYSYKYYTLVQTFCQALINSLKQSLLREKTMHEYKVNILRVVDGDTVDVDIDLGFGMWLRKERVRVMGIDTPESRTSDKMEKVFGLAAKERLTSLLGAEAILHTQVSKKGEDMKGKFGRVLGNFVSLNGEKCAAVLIREGHAVAYQGGSKQNIASQHLANRERLVREGAVVIPEELKTVSIAPVKKIIEPVVESVGKPINEPVPATRKPAAKKTTAKKKTKAKKK
jgi:micrococcal nuclease